MGRQINLVAHAWTKAKPAAVYGLLREGATWPSWSPMRSFSLERAGKDGGESVGAVRVFRKGLIRSRDEIVELRPEESLRYVTLSGPAIRAHLAHVTLLAEEGGTLVVWRESFEAKIFGSGRLLRRLRRRFVGRCVEGLAAHAARLDRGTNASRRS